jgi:hypothetical protein
MKTEKFRYIFTVPSPQIKFKNHWKKEEIGE